MAYRTNDNVQTPKGAGVVQGQMDGQALVRVQVPGSTEPNCVTPRARLSSLWCFDAGELKPV